MGSPKDGDKDEVLEIGDPRVPAAIRAHAARFREPIHFVVIAGPDFVLLAKDGSVVDICSL